MIPPGKPDLVGLIVIAIALHWIARHLALVGHCDCERCGVSVELSRRLKGGRDVSIEPTVNLKALVHLAVASGVLTAELKTV